VLADGPPVSVPRVSQPLGDGAVPFIARPLAVGILRAERYASVSTRSRMRVALALFANDEGYALAETFEVDGNAMRDEATMRGVAELAERLDAEALIVSGAVDRKALEEIADRVRMVIREATD
jgi:hypothetical protein